MAVRGRTALRHGRTAQHCIGMSGRVMSVCAAEQSVPRAHASCFVICRVPHRGNIHPWMFKENHDARSAIDACSNDLW